MRISFASLLLNNFSSRPVEPGFHIMVISKEVRTELEKIENSITDSKATSVERDEFESFKSLMESRISLLEQKIENQDARIELLESTISLKTSTVEALKEEVLLLREKTCSLDQYQRRPNLRINGVVLPPKGTKETNDDVMKIVKNVCDDLDVDLRSDDVFRAHRIGKKKKNEADNTYQQSVIIRFRSWKTRCALYRNRPTKGRPRAQKPDQPRIFSSISLDLTDQNYRLLDRARELITDKTNGDIEGIYPLADINCNLQIHLGENLMKQFSTERDMMRIISEIES